MNNDEATKATSCRPRYESTASETWGACGIQGCSECLPFFDADNNPVAEACAQ